MTRVSRQAIILAAVPSASLIAGTILHLGGRPELGDLAWNAGIVPVLGFLLFTIVSSLAKGDIGLDIIAALAMGGALVGGEPLAGVVVAMMFAGGEALEDFAQGRAASEMTALLARVPRTAMAYRAGALEQVPHLLWAHR